MAKDKNQKPLEMPSRVRKPRQDIVEGFGPKEAIITAVAGVVALILFLVINSMVNNIIVPLGVGIMIIGLTIMFIYRDICDESLIDKIVIVYNFTFKEQKQYIDEYDDYRFPGIRKFCEPEEEEECQ